MPNLKANQLKQEIANLESQVQFLSNAVAQLMAEANYLDLEIDNLVFVMTQAQYQIRDLKAELADTI